MASGEEERDRDAPALAAAAPRLLAPRVGWIAAVAGGALLVDFRGNTAGPIAARTTVPLTLDAALEAASRRQEALLTFEDGDPSLPIIVGLMQPPVPTLIDLALEDAEPPPAPPTALVDGKRVLLEAEDEVVLRCGEASITLRRNGKIVIRGAYVESHAAGTNRIKGGSVRIN
jgi:hypothetical protein